MVNSAILTPNAEFVMSTPCAAGEIYCASWTSDDGETKQIEMGACSSLIMNSSGGVYLNDSCTIEVSVSTCFGDNCNAPFTGGLGFLIIYCCYICFPVICCCCIIGLIVCCLCSKGSSGNKDSDSGKKKKKKDSS